MNIVIINVDQSETLYCLRSLTNEEYMLGHVCNTFTIDVFNWQRNIIDSIYLKITYIIFNRNYINKKNFGFVHTVISMGLKKMKLN